MNSLISPDPWEPVETDIDWLNVDPWQLPSVALQDKNCLPNQGGIYFAIRQRRVLYIGKADRSIKGRWLTHHRYKQLEAMGDVKIAFYHPNVDSLYDLERQLTKLFDPKFNDTPVDVVSVDDVMALHRQQMTIKNREIEALRVRQSESTQERRRLLAFEAAEAVRVQNRKALETLGYLNVGIKAIEECIKGCVLGIGLCGLAELPEHWTESEVLRQGLNLIGENLRIAVKLHYGLVAQYQRRHPEIKIAAIKVVPKTDSSQKSA